MNSSRPIGSLVEPDRIYVDHGLTGTNRARSGLREAMAACRTGDTLVGELVDDVTGAGHGSGRAD